MQKNEMPLSRVEGQPLSGSAELPQRPIEDVPPTLPEKNEEPPMWGGYPLTWGDEG